MSRTRTYLRSLAANGIGYGVNLAVVFFMAPFVVHTLGNVQYGVWSLMMTLTGYLGLVELGMRSGVGRFVNYYLGKNDIDKVNEVVSTSIIALLGFGLLLVLTATTLAALLPFMFPEIPISLVPAARLVTLIISVNLLLGFLSSPFRHVLVAFERFDLTNGADLLVTFVRTAAIVAALLAGYGLVALALIQLVSSIIGQVCMFRLANYVFPRLTVRRSLFSWERLRELFGYSIWAFVGSIANELLYTTDIIVIGALLGPKWITFYTVGGMLLQRGRQSVVQVTRAFSPRILQDCARREWETLRVQYRQGSTVVVGLGVLLLVGMIVFGHEFIALWMGPEFEISYRVLVVLATASLTEVAFLLGNQFYLGLNRVRLMAMLALTQGLVNLGLSLLFVVTFHQGILGVAWGTFYPRVVFSLISAIIVMRWVRYPLNEFLRELVARWIVLGVLFWGAASWIDSWAPALTWSTFATKVAIAVVVYCCLAWSVLLSQKERDWVRRVTADRWSMAFARRSA